MGEKRFWFVIDNGKLEYVQDNVTGEKITVTELEDLLNEQQATISALKEENEQLKKIMKQQTMRMCCQDKEIQKWIEKCDSLERYIESKGLSEECIKMMKDYLDTR